MFGPEVSLHVLDGLWCGAKYQIYIIASNSLGLGEESETFTVKTKGSGKFSNSQVIELATMFSH